MELGLHPGIIFALAIGLFLGLHLLLRWPLPLTFIAVAVAAALFGDFGIPFRHLVEGAFGFMNLVLALFAGAFFGQMMRKSGAADAAATAIVRAAGSRVLPVLTLAGLPVFAVGMFVGIAGVAVLSAGVFAVPALRRIGYDNATTAAFIAVMATAGMIAPPMNVPAQLIADGVNMPWTNIAKPLLALSLPLAAAALAWFAWRGPRERPVGPHAPLQAESRTRGDDSLLACLRGFAPLALILAIWMVVRISDAVVDPASPLILVTGAMSLQAPWSYPSILVGMPLLGGALTAMAASDVLGVPAAFSFIGQDMILNVAALSAVASLAEFVPPTSIAAALACYVVGGGTVGQVARRAWPPLAVLAALAMLMLVFAKELGGILT